MVARVVLSESACDEHAAKTLAGRSEVLMTLLVPVAVVAHYYAAAESAAGSFVVVVVVAVVVGSENSKHHNKELYLIPRESYENDNCSYM